MSDDLFDLPKRPRVEVLPREQVRPAAHRLTEKQLDRVLDTGSRLAADVGAVARELVAIHRIREQGRMDVERIDAETRHVVGKMRAAIDLVAEETRGIRARGQAAAEVISAITRALQTIPELDGASRKALVESLPRLVELAVGEKTRER